MKIYFRSSYKFHKNTQSLWHGLKPYFERLWNKQLIYIGLNWWHFVIDLRNINNIQDFYDALQYPNIWHILKKLNQKEK